MSDNTSIADLLILVQAYCDSHEAADDHFQNAVWNLTKARRKCSMAASATEYTASSIRHELKAKTRIIMEEEVFCVVGEEPRAGSNTTETTASTSSPSWFGGGLRHRKANAAIAKQESSKTIVEDIKNTEAEEDPLLLLAGSLPPRELRIAQQRARQSLDSYIQAATLMAALQKRLSQE